jgi:hypothetical protein
MSLKFEVGAIHELPLPRISEFDPGALRLAPNTPYINQTDRLGLLYQLLNFYKIIYSIGFGNIWNLQSVIIAINYRRRNLSFATAILG